jgi:transposase
MYDFMNRAAIRKFRKEGWSLRKLARKFNMHRDTVKRLLEEPLTKKYERQEMPHAALPYRSHILNWLDDGVPVTRMLELASEDLELTYEGSRSAFFAGVAKIRREVEAETKRRYIRFEGLPGEYAQVDWGEVRNFSFSRTGPRTKYFLAVRLKFSRVSFVKWTDSMTQEVLLRALIEAFEYFGGVPWALVFDNMKTVTLGRDEHGRPIWHPILKHFANDFDFNPEACDRACGNQKGSVENLVGWVKSNFVPGRKFLDNADLAEQNRAWMEKVNHRTSQSHGEIPWEVLPDEQRKFGNLPCSVSDYGLLRYVCSNRDGYIHLEGFQYLVPIGLAEQPLILRLREKLVELYDGGEKVVSYPRRSKGDGKVTRREINPDFLEPMLVDRPKARVMVYRDHLYLQHPEIATYISGLCRARRGVENFGPHILKLYKVLKEHGVGELAAACNLAGSEGAFGAEYVAALIQEPPIVRELLAQLQLGPEVPSQAELNRDLEVYESFAIRDGGPND